MSTIVTPRLASLAKEITLAGFNGIARKLNGEAKFEKVEGEETPQVVREDLPERKVKLVLPGMGWSPIALQKGVRLHAQIEIQALAAQRANPVQIGTDGKPVLDDNGKPIVTDTRIGDAGGALGFSENLSEVLALYYIYDTEALFLESTYAQRVEQFDNNIMPFTGEQLEELASDFFGYFKSWSRFIPASLKLKT